MPAFDANGIAPPPPGGYKMVDKVIRNAPFPIKPQEQDWGVPAPR